jgi:hypothetical protein
VNIECKLMDSVLHCQVSSGNMTCLCSASSEAISKIASTPLHVALAKNHSQSKIDARSDCWNASGSHQSGCRLIEYKSPALACHLSCRRDFAMVD